MQGWPEIYSAGDELDTVGYAYSQGKIAALIECGSHTDPKCYEVAETAVNNFLIYTGIISGNSPEVQQNITKITTMIRKERPGILMQDFFEMQEVKK